ncbi:hypothetical protein [Gordonia westfalica]|uniref:Uncharacterized protein n=1 Tax=Gordonia westfalica TaxID=158898 RepID=A0A1H2DMA8_9ACTN|nr:hypothetical protein [Gordonia westfalica]SDT83881.1 hypothetical protein SAMN04488548_10514 [Gordonia westfalica]
MSNWQKTSEGDFHRKSQHLASVGVTPQKPSASTIFVDPAMARRVLAKNTHNRPIKESQVVRLMAEMTSGRWKYNGEAIKWSIDDVLLDGQHRLTALARMDDNFPAIPFLVVRGLPADTQSTMDQGTTRTAGDQLVLEGFLVRLIRGSSQAASGSTWSGSVWRSSAIRRSQARSATRR